MKKLLLLLATILFLQYNARSDEGMWIPLYLGELNEAEMQAMGMKITAEDIYSVNQSSLKDAIVLFGRGCTAELVSDEGLILTNHHCGYGRIQAHSSLENDYLTDGFWAMDRSEELSNPGLTVTFLVRMEEVTEKVLDGVDENMSEKERLEVININIEEIEEEAVKDTHYKALIKSFFSGNRYFLFINEIFKDVRLVGAPPSNIGKFGGDTDNWMWPRHTGDFSIFRIYADSLNKPADYSEDNVPYKPKKYIPVSIKGVSKGDFTFVFGYPGRTQSYIPSYGVDMQVNVINPISINLRAKRIDIFNKEMNKSKEVRIQYSGKQASISNGWKKAIGETRGITRLKTIESKQAFEEEFNLWASSSPELNSKYGSLLDEFEKDYEKIVPLIQKSVYALEAGLSAEIIRYALSFDKLVDQSKNKDIDNESIQNAVEKLKGAMDRHFKNYQLFIDKEVFISMMTDYYQNNKMSDIPPVIADKINKYNGDFEKMTDDLFSKSMFASKENTITFLEKYKKSHYKKIKKDPAYKLADGIASYRQNEVKPDIRKLGRNLDSLMRIYMQAQMEMQPMKKFYPDANMSLRVAYGNIDGYNPDDAVTFKHYTTLDGIMEKEDPDIYDYVVEDKLEELYNSKDYGRYADSDGTIHVCFTATNHTTGGNSGSPVLDAEGNLIGLNFDRCWEGTMSDIDYDISQCRNIALDIRYCLFIIDKFAGAGHLVDEMTIIE